VIPARAPIALGVLAAAGLIGGAALCSALEVQVTTVRAADSGPSDAQLVALRPRLRRLVGYRSFQVVNQERRECQWQSGYAFMLPGGRLLHVMPKGMRDQAVVMQVRLVDGSRALLDTDVRLQNRGVMLLGVDQNARASNDSALIIMLRAEE
jgi:hypothetical protein